MPPIEDQRRASVTYARTSAFSELDHQLTGHPKSQRGAAAHKPTAHRNRVNTTSKRMSCRKHVIRRPTNKLIGR